MGVDELRARARASDPILWVFLGDSITHGALHTFGWRDYTEIFAERVRFELGRQGDLVLNAAYSGYTAPRLASELDHRCLRFRPQVVSIMIGTNDAKAGPAGLTEFETTLTDMVRRVQAETAAHVILQMPPPIDTRNAPERESLPRYAEAMRRVARATDAALCDHEAAWLDFEARSGRNRFYLLSDPFHPNEHGHRFLAQTFLDWLGYGGWDNTTPWAGLRRA
ncbi:MAG: SGNH/GDSL hydrolase family protein [Anaerolineae bacterium]|nr:SGNH/GDSL hydrolase family protein [Anaerolineae bacterium]